MEQFVTLKIFTDELNAQMAKNLLEAASITVKIQSDNAGGMMPHLSFSNGIKVLVLKSDFEKAQDLLNS